MCNVYCAGGEQNSKLSMKTVKAGVVPVTRESLRWKKVT